MGGEGAAYKWGRLLAGVYGIYLTDHNAEQREGFRQTRGNFQWNITQWATVIYRDNKKSCAETTVGLGRDEYEEPVSIVFNTSFRNTSSWYNLWLVDFDS